MCIFNIKSKHNDKGKKCMKSHWNGEIRTITDMRTTTSIFYLIVYSEHGAVCASILLFEPISTHTHTHTHLPQLFTHHSAHVNEAMQSIWTLKWMGYTHMGLARVGTRIISFIGHWSAPFSFRPLPLYVCVYSDFFNISFL